MIDTDAKENSNRIQAEKDARLKADEKDVLQGDASEKRNSGDSKTDFETFDRARKEIIAELEDALAKLRRMQGNSNQELTIDKEIPTDTESVT